MNGRSIGGLIVTLVGFIISLIPLFSNSDEAYVALFYGIPIFVIGLFVFFNKNEDKIEQVKGGYKEK